MCSVHLWPIISFRFGNGTLVPSINNGYHKVVRRSATIISRRPPGQTHAFFPHFRTYTLYLCARRPASERKVCERHPFIMWTPWQRTTKQTYYILLSVFSPHALIPFPQYNKRKCAKVQEDGQAKMKTSCDEEKNTYTQKTSSAKIISDIVMHCQTVAVARGRYRTWQCRHVLIT